MSTKAIILAAGKSSRLYPLTIDTPKGLLDVAGVQPIVRIVHLLNKEGIEDITVVVGHKKEKIMSALGSAVTFHDFLDFETKNNFHTLWSIREKIVGDTLILYSDVIFESALLKKVLAPYAGDIALVIDTSAFRPESPRVRIDHGLITKIGKGKRTVTKEGFTCNFLGMTKLSPQGAKEFVKAMESLVENPDAYYSDAVSILIQNKIPVIPIDIAGLRWIEIDTLEELETARRLMKEIA
ncbi:phosphocholine cytidylyltransferase family protein [Candidatus Peregrinibacteria bacterium]|nr:phosphocholine cytidylyltransferase family protein [Candidatus Peregrinibacteria bacterium]